MRRSLWLDSKKSAIIEMYQSGMKQIEIAEHFNVSQTSISLRLRKWEVSNPDGNRFIRKVDISKEELYDMYWNKKMHPDEIAEIFGCHKTAIHYKMNKCDIPWRTKSEARMGKLNPIYEVGHTDETKKKMSQAFVNGRKMGYNTHWGKGSYYDTPNQGRVWMRSGWEVKTANYLTENDTDWYYEYKWLPVTESMSYLPDFYLPEFDCYIEVKGRKKGKDMEKIRSAQKEYKILLWDGEELLRRGIINNSGSTKVNRRVGVDKQLLKHKSGFEL